MPELRDVIDAMLGDFYAARISADMRAVDIMNMYKDHEILQNFKIPQFAISNMVLEIPVKLEAITRHPIENPTITLKTQNLVDVAFKHLSRRTLNELRKRLKRSEQILFKQKAINLTLSKLETENQSYEKIINALPELSKGYVHLIAATLNTRKEKLDEKFFRKWDVLLHQSLMTWINTQKEEYSGTISDNDKAPTHLASYDKHLLISLNSSQVEEKDGSNKQRENVTQNIAKLTMTVDENGMRIEKVPSNRPGEFKTIFVHD